MSIKKFVVGSFDDEKVLFPAVKRVRAAGFKIHDVYTPYAVHGLDHALGLRQTSLHTAAFIFGITGTATAILGIGWCFDVDWLLNIGGKPHFPLPAMIPIAFELTVLFAAVGMTYTFCWLCQLAPGAKKHVFNPRSSDDKFVMVVECTEKTNVGEAQTFLSTVGAEEVHVQDAEAGWWWGMYGKTEVLYREEL